MKRLIAIILDSPHRRYLCAFILLYLLFQSPLIISGLLRPAIVNLLIKSAHNSGVALEISDSSLNFPRSLVLSHVHLKAHNPLTPPMHLDRLELVIKSYYPLHVYLSNDLLGGNIRCDIKPKSVLVNFLAGNCVVSRINLSSYAPLYAAGIKGLLDGSIEGSFSSASPSQNIAEFSFGLSDGYFDAISKGLFDNPSAPISRLVKLPPITDIQVQAKGSLKTNYLHLEHGDIFSSMGSVTSITGKIDKEGSEASNNLQLKSSNIALEIQGNLQLNELGIKHIAPWIALKSGNQSIGKESMRLLLSKPVNGVMNFNVLK